MQSVGVSVSSPAGLQLSRNVNDGDDEKNKGKGHLIWRLLMRQPHHRSCRYVFVGVKKGVRILRSLWASQSSPARQRVPRRITSLQSSRLHSSQAQVLGQVDRGHAQGHRHASSVQVDVLADCRCIRPRRMREMRTIALDDPVAWTSVRSGVCHAGDCSWSFARWRRACGRALSRLRVNLCAERVLLSVWAVFPV